MATSNLQQSTLPPGNPGLPLIGETISFLTDPEFTAKRQARYGDIFRTHIFGQPTVIVSGAEANRFLLSNENRFFTATWPKSTRVLLGPGSLSMQGGEIHRSRRKLLAQAFAPRALASYVSTMAVTTRQYLQHWEQLSQFAWYPELRNYTFDVACQLLVGQDGGAATPLGEWFESWCEGLFTIPLRIPGTKFNRAVACRKKLLKEIEQIICQRQSQPPSNADALGLLLQARDDDGEALGLEELKDQILTLLFAGHETLTSAIASFCLLMAQHPEVLANVRAEQQQIPLEEPLTLEQLKPMTYLDQVLQEVLRTVPPVGGGFRQVIQACEFAGYQIPVGWSVLYQVGRTHNDPNLYSHPNLFNPGRFDPEGNEATTFGYIPFGGGVRECLGKEFARLEMKLFAALLTRQDHWELVPDQNLELIMTPTPHPRDGLRVYFHPWDGSR